MGLGCSKADQYGAGAEEEPQEVHDDRPPLHEGPVFCVAPAGVDEFLTCGDDKVVRLSSWSAAEPLLQEWRGHERSVSRCVSSPAGVFSCSRDLTIRRWTRDSPTCTDVLTGHTLNISALCVSGDASLLFSGARDTTVRVWDTATLQTTSQAKTSRNLVTCAAFCGPDSTVVAQGSEDLSVHLWDARDGCREVQKLAGYVYFPLAIDTSADGSRLLTSSKGFDGTGCEVRLWDRRSGASLLVMEGHQQDATGCAFVRGGERFAVSVSKDRRLRVWDLASGECVTTHLQDDVGMFTSVSSAAEGSGADVYASGFSGAVYAYRIGVDDGAVELAWRTAVTLPE